MNKLKRSLIQLTRWISSAWFSIVQSILQFFTRHKWVHHHIEYRADETTHTKPTPLKNLVHDRFDFALSYATTLVKYKSENWYETLKGKRLYTLHDETRYEGTLTFRAELRSFEIHLNPSSKKWLSSSKNSVVTYYNLDRPKGIVELSNPATEVVSCDFSKCRYGFRLTVPHNFLVDDGVRIQTLMEGRSSLYRMLVSAIPEINETLTGVKNDGEPLSPKGQPLVDDLVCKYCGLPVFSSPRNGYFYECIEHGELDKEGVRRISSIRYRDLVAESYEVLSGNR